MLDGMPSLLPLYGRAGLGAVPGAGLARAAAAVSGRAGGDELPGRGSRRRPRRVGRRMRSPTTAGSAGSPCANELPATYPHVLSFPLQMALMSSGSFPFPLLGLVHLDDEITQHRPIGIGEPLDFEVRAADLRPHPKGTAFSLIVEARSDGELVWEERGTILHRGGGDPDAAARVGPEARARDAPAVGRVAAARRPRPPLRGRLRRSQPDPPASADRPGVRLPAADRPRDVDDGPLPRAARGAAPGRVHRRASPSASRCRCPAGSASRPIGPERGDGVRGSRRAAGNRRFTSSARSRPRRLSSRSLQALG